ncbi:MAG TPA: glycosyltransferase [Bryobacteraceae bacterium]|nr:glycosyltransferase [Bryobacteraceae bacterium]
MNNGYFILLPILNEIANVGRLLDQIESALAGSFYTVGILDDGSTDGTVAYLQERMRRPDHHLFLICRKKTARSSQRGAALLTLLRWGLVNTGHEIFIEMDGDLSHRPQELLEGIRLVAEQRCDVAIASKYMPGSQVINRPAGRRLISRVCSVAVAALLSPRVRDYSNGFRFYTRAAAQVVAGHKIRYGSPIYLSEVLALWLRQGLRVQEFPTTYIGRNEGVSNLRMLDLLKAGTTVFEISLRYHVLGFAPCSAELAPPAESETARQRSQSGGR